MYVVMCLFIYVWGIYISLLLVLWILYICQLQMAGQRTSLHIASEHILLRLQLTIILPTLISQNPRWCLYTACFILPTKEAHFISWNLTIFNLFCAINEINFWPKSWALHFYLKLQLPQFYYWTVTLNNSQNCSKYQRYIAIISPSPIYEHMQCLASWLNKHLNRLGF